MKEGNIIIHAECTMCAKRLGIEGIISHSVLLCNKCFKKYHPSEKLEE